MATIDIVNGLYQTILNRTPSSAEAAGWVNLINNGFITAAQAQSDIANSFEALNNVAPIVEMYQDFLGRAPDQAGLAGWVSLEDNGKLTLAQIENDIANSAESQNLYGTSVNSAFVTALYETILGRAPEAGAVNAWLAMAQTNGLTAAQVEEDFYSSSEAQARANPGVMNFFNSAAAGNPSAYVGSIYVSSSPANSAFALTTGVDTATANKFTGSLGTDATFGGLDTLTGTAGGTNNLLQLVDDGATDTAVYPTATTLSNIPTISLATAGNAGEYTATHTLFNVSGVSGLTTLTVTSNGTLGDDIKAGATTNVTDTYQGNGGTADGINIIGGENVTLSDAGSFSGVTVGGGAVATDPAGTVSVSENGATAASVTVKGGTSVGVTTAATGNVIVGGAAAVSPSGAITVTDAATGSGTIAVDGGTSATVTTASTGTVTIDGTTATSGPVAVTDTGGTGGITVDGGASANVAATSTAGNAVTITGVTGATSVTESAVAVGATTAVTVNGGTGTTVTTTGGTVVVGTTTPVAGNATITDSNTATNADPLTVYATGAVGVTTTADSGAINVGNGTAANDPTGAVTILNETVAGSTTNYGTGTTTVDTNGAPTVSITGGDAAGINDEGTTNTLTAINLSGVDGAATIGDNALSSLSIANSTTATPTTATVTNTTAHHTLAVALSGDTSTATSITDSHAAAFNVTASGVGADDITVVAGDAHTQAYNFTNNGTGTLTVEGLTDTGSTGTTITVGGTGAVNLGDLHSDSNITTAINASSNTGGVTATIEGDLSQGFTGGSGPNVVTVDSGSTLNANINGGSGTNNTLILTSTAAHYGTGLGASLSGFQNLELSTGATGGYNSAPFAGSLLVNNPGHSVAFTSVASGESLKILNAANTTATYSTPTSGDTIVINGVTATLTASTQANAIAVINALGLPGVQASAGAGTSTIITGADTITLGGTDTGTISSAFTNLISDGLATVTGSNTLPLTIGTATTASPVTAVLHEANNGTINITSLGLTTTPFSNVLTIDDGTTSGQANPATALTISGAAGLKLGYYVDGTATNSVATINASAATGAVDVTNVIGAATGVTITGGSGVLTAYGSGIQTMEALSPSTYYTANDSIVTGTGGGIISLGVAGAGGTGGTTAVNLTASVGAVDTIIVGSSAVKGDRATITGFTTSGSAADILTFAVNETALGPVSTATASAGTDLYTISNGVATFTGADGLTQLILDARALVDTAASQVVAFGYNGNTYVVASGSAAQNATTDIVLTLTGTSGVSGLFDGTTGATNGANILDISNITATNLTAAPVANASGNTVADAGYENQALTGTATGTVTINNLGPSATVDLSGLTSGQTFNLTTKLASAGGTLVQANGVGAVATTIATDTVSDVAAFTLAANSDGGAGNDTVTTLVSADNLLTSLNLTGGAATNTLTIGAITDSGLTAIKSTTADVVDLGSSGAALSQTNLAVTLGVNTAASSAVYLSGSGSSITASATTTAMTLSDTASKVTIAGGTGLDTIIAGAGATVTMAAANTAANIIKVGTGSSVTLGTTDSGGSTINVTGDVTGATSVGPFALTTINNADAGSTKIQFLASGTDGTAVVVNVASATSLANALDIAAENLGGFVSAHDYYAGFQYGGNTYVLEHAGTGSAAVGLSAVDNVVKVTGLVSLGSFGLDGAHGVTI